MWIPKSAADLERAAREPLGIPETTSCDCKRELPAPHKNRALAEDVAAMANEGGVLIYGIGEDQQRRAKELRPFILAGAKEKIDQIVQTGVAEPPYFVPHLRPLYADPDRGYLVIEVPVSPRAPHMVIHSGDHRYYRRTPTGNMVMNPAEVEAMFRRREDWGRRAADELDAALRREIETPKPDLATLRIVARPVAIGGPILAGHARRDSPDRSVLVRAVQRAQEAVVPEEVLHHSRSMARNCFGAFLNVMQWARSTSGWATSFQAERHRGIDDPRGSHYLQVDDLGLVMLHCGRMGEVKSHPLGWTQDGEVRSAPQMRLFVDWAGETVVRFSAFAGSLLDDASVSGPVDVAVLISPTENALANRGWPTQQPIHEQEYRRQVRIPAAQLREDPLAVADLLLTPLLDALSQGHYSPFASSSP